jgi:hypothetical protein
LSRSDRASTTINDVLLTVHANGGSPRAIQLARAVIVSALILTSAPGASAEGASGALSAARNAETERQAVDVVYRDITDLLSSMQRVLAQKQRRADATTAANQAFARAPRGDDPVMPSYGEVSEPAEPCKGAQVSDWRRCLGQVDQNLARLGDAERRSLAPQIDALRAGVNAAVGDARLAAADLQAWTAQLRRTSQTLDAMRVNRPIPR